MRGESFHALITHILREHGQEVFEQESRCRAFLNDYAKGAHKTEIQDFLLGIKLRRAPGEDRRGDRLSRELAARIGPERASAVMGPLQALFHLEPSGDEDESGAKIEGLQKAAKGGDFRAMYELGLALESRGWHEEANHWLKKVAKQGLALYEQAIKNPPAPAGSAADFVRVPGGTFIMGSPITEPGWSNEETQHQVRLSGFYLDRKPVTQQDYAEAAGVNPSRFVGRRLPVENVSWFDAAAYCNLRSQQEGLAPAYTIKGGEVAWNRDAGGYRLPTEAEWEYACRAGTKTPFSTGARITTEQANFNGTIPAAHTLLPGIFRGATTPSGTFPPNPWGLYDMHGNVYEWCWDWYGEYRIGLQQDPTGPARGSEKVIRGGSWNYPAFRLRSASRARDVPAYRGGGVGFRLLLPL